MGRGRRPKCEEGMNGELQKEEKGISGRGKRILWTKGNCEEGINGLN